MVWSKFKTRVPAKWILAGEHAVLRGATAVALPHPELSLELSFAPFEANEEQNAGFSVEPASAETVIHDLLTAVSEAWMAEGKTFPHPSGHLTIESTIPIGAGLGSSAALCVALSRWMAGPLSFSESKIVDFATHLEHRFHGRSSGLDVAVISSGEPISFAIDRGSHSMGVKKLPKFTFHDTGMRTRTSECVVKVEKFREEIPAVAVKVDEEMSAASRLAMEGLVRYDLTNGNEGLSLIQDAMMQARECFYSWELVPGKAKRMEQDLLRNGALAVKLTGAGGGGILVALWA